MLPKLMSQAHVPTCHQLETLLSSITLVWVLVCVTHMAQGAAAAADEGAGATTATAELERQQQPGL